MSDQARDQPGSVSKPSFRLCRNIGVNSSRIEGTRVGLTKSADCTQNAGERVSEWQAKYLGPYLEKLHEAVRRYICLGNAYTPHYMNTLHTEVLENVHEAHS